MKKVVKKKAIVAKKASKKIPLVKKSSVKKYGDGGTKVDPPKKTPFQEYMKTPGAVASDTVISRKPVSSTAFDKSTLNKPTAKNPKNTKALIKASEKTYGMDVWDRPWTTGTKSKYLTPAEEKEFRRIGSNYKNGGTVGAKKKTVAKKKK